MAKPKRKVNKALARKVERHLNRLLGAGEGEIYALYKTERDVSKSQLWSLDVICDRCQDGVTESAKFQGSTKLIVLKQALAYAKKHGSLE